MYILHHYVDPLRSGERAAGRGRFIIVLFWNLLSGKPRDEASIPYTSRTSERAADVQTSKNWLETNLEYENTGFTSDDCDAIIPESKTGRMWWIDEDGAEAQGGGMRSAAGRGWAVKRLLQGRAQSLCEGNFNIA